MRRLILLILVVAIALRFTGIGYGLDLDDVNRSVFTSNVDEQHMVRSVLQDLLHGDLDPGPFVVRGSTCFYLFGLVAAGVFGLASLFEPGGWTGTLAALQAQPAPLFLLLRGVSAFAGVLTVLAVMRLGRRELGDRAGLMAGALVAVCYLHVRLSHAAVTDPVFVLLVVVALDRMLLALRDPRPRRFLWAGIWSGAATGAKYFGGLLGLPIVVTWLVARSRGSARARDLALVLAGCVVGFAVASPNTLVAPGAIVDALRFQSKMLIEPAPAQLLERVTFHLQHSLGVGLGETALLLAIGGLIVGWRAGGTTRLVAALPLLVLPMMIVADAPTVRFALSVAVLLCLPAALALDRATAGRSGVFVTLAVGLALAPSLVRSATFDEVLLQDDTRSEMLAAVVALDVPAKDVLAVGGYGLPRTLDTEGRPYIDAFPLLAPEGLAKLEELVQRRPRYVLWEYSNRMPLPKHWPFDLQQIVQDEYRPILNVDELEEGTRRRGPIDPGEKGYPGLYVPFAKPWTVERPGPRLTLYERRGLR